MADDDLGRFPLISEVLRRSADRDKGMQLIPFANLRPSVDRHMGQYSGSLSDRDMLTDHAERPDLHIIGKTSPWDEQSLLNESALLTSSMT